MGVIVSTAKNQRLVCVCGSRDFESKGLSPPLKCSNRKRRRRFRCMKCKRSMSENYFSLNFRCKKSDLGLNQKIFVAIHHGASFRQIARELKISEHCVRIRVGRMAKRALDFHPDVLTRIKNDRPIQESLCYDGIENFAGSQYDPNNINQVVGSDSLFIYDFSFSSLNRKGYMSPWQKKRLLEIECQNGRFDPQANRNATTLVLRRVAPLCRGGKLYLKSDEHFQYRQSIQVDLKDIDITHETVSAKKCRNFQNILFPINHIDLIIRQRVAAFTRETISFSKTASNMCHRFALFLIQKNYFVPQFTKPHKKRHGAHTQTPAQAIGVASRPLQFHDIFWKRSITPSASLSEEWLLFYQGKIPTAQKRSQNFVRTLSQISA